MKIKKISLQGYKKFIQHTEFSFFIDENESNHKTLIVGNNGSGKTSILQAIVLIIASATRENFTFENFDWLGYEFRHLQSGKIPLKIEIEVVFDENEVNQTKNFANKLKELGVKLGETPGSDRYVTLCIDYHKMKVVAKGGTKSYYQFSGYQYAKRLSALTINKNQLFENVGNIYWYSEQRNSNNISNLIGGNAIKLDDIRTFLSSAYSYHLAIINKSRDIKEGEFDFYDKLQKIYSKVFSGRSFLGSAPRFDIYEESSVPDFFLYDGKNQYEISGMSAGERAVFPILMDFARWNINNSIIIIDELELHLHPPLQQTLVRVLSDLGNNNQFILTTHSNNVSNLFEESEILRLPNE